MSHQDTEVSEQYSAIPRRGGVGSGAPAPGVAISVDSNIGATQVPKFSPRDVRFANWLCFFAWAGAVYDFILFGNLLPVIAADFGLDEAGATGINTWITAGTAIVAFLLGRVVDRVGRRKGLMIAVAGAAVASLLTATTGLIFGLFAGLGLVLLVLIRTVAGLGYAEMAVNATYLSEVYATTAATPAQLRRRGLTYSLVQSGWPVGAAIAAGSVALLLPVGGWELCFVVAAVPAVFIVWAARKLKESPQFAARQQIHKLRAADRLDEAKALAAEFGIEAEAAERTSVREIFQGESLRPILTITPAYLLNGMGALVFQILATSLMISETGMNIDFTNALFILLVSNGAAFLGYLFHGWLGDRIGRRNTIAIGWILSAVAYGSMLMLPQGAFGPVVALYSIGLFFLIGPFSALMFFTGESFPSRIRATATSIVTASGMVGNILAGAIVTALLASGTSWTTTAFIAGVIPVLLGGILILLSPSRDPKVARLD